jgi:hypothetical protein
MNLVNLDGLALIGPGSEWFWSMLQFVIVALTLYAIYRQVRLQGSTAAVEQASRLQGDWHSSERLIRSRLSVLEAIRDGLDPSTSARAAASRVGNFWEQVGYLVKAGHVDERLVYEYLGNSARLWWAWLGPTVHRWRKLEDEPKIEEHFEWLAHRVAEMDSAAGITHDYDEAYLRGLLPVLLRSHLDDIRTEEQMRAVIVQPGAPQPPARGGSVEQSASESSPSRVTFTGAD